MSLEIRFQGGHIFNPGYYPANVNTQSKPVLRAMGKNVRLDYSLVDEAGAARDLETEGFFLDSEAKAANIPQLDALPLSSDLVHRFATGLNDLTNDFVKDYYAEDIVVERGYDVFRSLAQHTLDNQVAEYTDNFFSSSYRSEGRYFSYQMAFYSMKRGSYCFMVFSMISYKNADYVFGIPVSVRTGLKAWVQLFPCKKRLDSFIYNTGVLRSSQTMNSRNGRYVATLTRDGNFVVDTRWQSGSAFKGQSPYFLAMQEDGNLAIYDARDQPVWASDSWQSGAAAQRPFYLELQDDGNLVIRNSSDRVLWEIGRA